MRDHNVTALVGAQFGSEGKGLIAGHIAGDYDIHVRVGAANAGHTLYTVNPFTRRAEDQYEKHVMQQLPCAAYANPRAMLVVGPGALISEDILARELRELADWRKVRGYEPPLVHIDHRAHVIHDGQIQREADSGLEQRIGSTSATAREGIGQAQADRVMRHHSCRQTHDALASSSFPEWDLVCICDTVGLLRYASPAHSIRPGHSILLEGTQGTGLSLTTGAFPYVTSRNTTSAGLLADAGVAPTRLKRVVAVARTYPIRVAGNSGPFHRESREIEWESLGVDAENERTTVTKKIRRVATFSLPQIVEAVHLNGATEIALTFADYLDPELEGESGPFGAADFVGSPVGELILEIEQATRVPVTMIGTGPHSVIEYRSAVLEWGHAFRRSIH